MKTKFKVIIAVVLVLSFSLVAFGAVAIEEIKASLANDMKFKVDGEMWQPVEVDGSRLSPIIYNGRSYVPVRALLEAKDVKVGYDNDTRTILLDYPKLEPQVIDKSTPLLIQKQEIGGPYKEWPNYDILFNKAFESDGLGFSNTVEMELADDTVLMINGKEMSVRELGKGEFTYALKGDLDGKVRVGIDEKSKLVKSIVMDGEIIEADGQDGSAARKVHVEITLAGPPWKLTIRIRF